MPASSHGNERSSLPFCLFTRARSRSQAFTSAIVVLRDPYAAIFSYYNYWLQASAAVKEGSDALGDSHVFRQSLGDFNAQRFESFALHKATQWRQQWTHCFMGFAVIPEVGIGGFLHDSRWRGIPQTTAYCVSTYWSLQNGERLVTF